MIFFHWSWLSYPDSGSDGIKVSNNKTTIWARLYDGHNGGNYVTGYINKIDKEKPEVPTFTTEKTTNTITVHANATDHKETPSSGESGIKTYWFSDDGGDTWEPTLGQTTKDYTFTDLGDGEAYNIKVKVADQAGNEATSSVEGDKGTEVKTEVIKDGNELKITFDNKGTEWCKSTYARITGKQDGCHIEFSLDNSDWEDYDESTAINIDHSGQKVKARLSDGKNNGEESIEVISEKVDDKDPTASMQITSKTTKSITVTAEGTDTSVQGNSASGVDEYWFSCTKPDGTVENSEWTNKALYTFDNIKYENNGAYKVTVKVRDLAERESTEVSSAGNLEKLILQDADIKIKATPGEGEWTNEKVIVTITTDKPDVTIKYATQWNGSEPNYQDYQVDQQIEVDKQNTEVLAKLTDGTNTSEDNATLKINNIDKNAPGVTIETDETGENPEIIGVMADAEETADSRS